MTDLLKIFDALAVVVDPDTFIKYLVVAGSDCEDRCCSTPVDDCPGCSDTPPTELQIDIDASAATEMPSIFPETPAAAGCDDGDCQDLTGTYLAAILTAPVGPVSICPAGIYETGYCFWESDEAVDTLPCGEPPFPDDQFGGPYTISFQIRLGKTFSSDNWWISLFMLLTQVDDIPVASYSWAKELSSSPPECSSIFPITFGSADYCPPTPDSPFPGINSDQFTKPCFFEDIDITIDIP